MQEMRHDGSDILSTLRDRKQLEKALMDQRNESVAVHKPGTVFQSRNGQDYLVRRDGSVRKVRFSTSLLGVAEEAMLCASAYEGDVLLIGNVRADALAEVLRDYIALRNKPAG